MRRSVFTLALVIPFIAVCASRASAGAITTRTDLQTILGGPGTLEDFESFVIAAGDAAFIDCHTLSSSSICNGQGPGLVVGGVEFTPANGLDDLQWDGAGYFGAPSQELLSGGSLIVDFTTFVNAFGVDLRDFEGFNSTATMTIYGLDDATIIGTFPGLLLSNAPVFAGWSDTSGIGKIVLGGSQVWSPIIDNLEFGTAAVPEPGTALLFGFGVSALGVLRRRAQRRL